MRTRLLLFLALTGLGSPMAIALLPTPPAQGVDETLLLARRRKKIPKSEDVSITEASIETRIIAGSPYHYLNGVVQNKGEETAHNISFYFEIYEKDTEKIVDAGTFVIRPPVLRPGGSIPFTRSVAAEGIVRVTLVRWAKSDRSPLKHPQMQLFSGTESAEE